MLVKKMYAQRVWIQYNVNLVGVNIFTGCPVNEEGV